MAYHTPTVHSIAVGQYSWSLFLFNSQRYVIVSFAPVIRLIISLQGNLDEIFDRDGWDFLQSLGTKYNKVVKIHGLVGVSVLLSLAYTHYSPYNKQYSASPALRVRPNCFVSDDDQGTGRIWVAWIFNRVSSSYNLRCPILSVDKYPHNDAGPRASVRNWLVITCSGLQVVKLTSKRMIF